MILFCIFSFHSLVMVTLRVEAPWFIACVCSWYSLCLCQGGKLLVQASFTASKVPASCRFSAMIVRKGFGDFVTPETLIAQHFEPTSRKILFICKLFLVVSPYYYYIKPIHYCELSQAIVSPHV